MAEVEMKWHDCPVEEFSRLHRVHPTGRYVSVYGNSLWFTVEYQMDGHKVDMTWWLGWRITQDWIINNYESLREQGFGEDLTDAYHEIMDNKIFLSQIGEEE